MSKDILFNNMTYEGVSKVQLPVEDGVATFQDVDEIVSALPAGILEIRTGELSIDSIVYTSHSFAHGCSKAPDIVVVNAADRTEVYNETNKPVNTYVVCDVYVANTIVSHALVSTSYAGATYPSSVAAAFLTAGNDGMITSVDETNVTIKTASNRRLVPELTYKWIAIVLGE